MGHELRVTAPPPRLTYSVAEAAQALGVGQVLVFQLLKEGRLTRLKVGRRTLVSAAELDAFLARLAQRAG